MKLSEKVLYSYLSMMGLVPLSVGSMLRSSTTLETQTGNGIQPGFKPGMMLQSRALWAGNEHYYPSGDTVQYYCSQAMFFPSPSMYQTWQDVPFKCQDISFDPMTGQFDGDWFGKFTHPGSVEITNQYKCLPEDACGYDITSDPDFGHCQVQAKTCGAQLNEILNESENSCDVWQLNLLHCLNKTTRQMEAKLVNVVTYASFAKPGFDKHVCPKRATFEGAEIIADPNASGGAAFVMQANFTNGVDLYDPCNWDCYNKTGCN